MFMMVELLFVSRNGRVTLRRTWWSSRQQEGKRSVLEATSEVKGQPQGHFLLLPQDSPSLLFVFVPSRHRSREGRGFPRAGLFPGGIHAEQRHRFPWKHCSVSMFCQNYKILFYWDSMWFVFCLSRILQEAVCRHYWWNNNGRGEINDR